MILKQADNKSGDIETLEQLLRNAGSEDKQVIERELRILRAGIKGEKEAAYLIDFHFGSSDMMAVIHDLRVEVGGRVAQIDHLLIHRSLNVFVLESKHFHAGVKIEEDGEFLMWNRYRRAYEGMASPIAQNERHINVLGDVFATIDMPTRLGVRLSPVFNSYVLVSPNARIVRPKRFDTSNVMKADALPKKIKAHFDKAGVFSVLGSAARMVSRETLQGIGDQLVALHQPIQVDYAAKFNVKSPQESPTHKTESGLAEPQCRKCGSTDLAIKHGPYGYYFKCMACQGNTPIKVDCGHPGHKERIRKNGSNFYRECSDCGTSSLFFVNQAASTT